MKPRLVEPGTYHHITRRCIGRQFLLRPDPAIINLLVYCFAVGAQRYGVDVLRLTLMSNHYHAMVFDRYGRLPEFLHWVNRQLALGLQQLRGVQGAVFEPGKIGDTIIASAEAFHKTMDYIHCNPVESGLVKHPEQWPGTLTPAQVTRLEATRPAWMGETCGPEHITLQLAEPEHFSTPGADPNEVSTYREALAEQDREAVKETWRQRKAKGHHRYLGAERAMRIRPTQAPGTQSSQQGSARFAAVTDIAKAVVKAKLKAFYNAYAEALALFRTGELKVAFPQGSWHMVKRLGCPCAASTG